MRSHLQVRLLVCLPQGGNGDFLQGLLFVVRELTYCLLKVIVSSGPGAVLARVGPIHEVQNVAFTVVKLLQGGDAFTLQRPSGRRTQHR
jgi:hypothetical protein